MIQCRLQGNLRSISGILSQWCKEPIISRAKGSKPMALDEFDLKHKERVGMRHSAGGKWPFWLVCFEP